MTWDDANAAFNAAGTDEELGKAMNEMLRELEASAQLRESTPKGALIKKCMGKRKSVGTNWGGESKKAFQALITVYAKPVVPKPAYKGQTMPPAYLFTSPTANVEGDDDDDDPEGEKYKYTNNFVYKPPPESSSDINPPPFVPVVPGASGGEVDDPDDDVPPPPKIDVPPPPAPLPTNVQSIEPAEEYMIDCTADGAGGDEKTTDVWCAEDEYERVTHINLFNNDVDTVEGLGKFPCLLRMTLRSNDCQTLSGMSEAKYLRWLDASSNDLKDVAGVDHMYALEWLDLKDNDLPSLTGCKFCPNVTFLNLQHNDLKDVEGVKQFPNIRWIDLSSNDLKTVDGLAACRNLVEINLGFNNISSLKPLMQLAKLPYLRRIDLSNNKLSASDRSSIHNYFQKHNRECIVVFDSELSDLARAHQDAGGDDGGCCAVM